MQNSSELYAQELLERRAAERENWVRKCKANRARRGIRYTVGCGGLKTLYFVRSTQIYSNFVVLGPFFNADIEIWTNLQELLPPLIFPSHMWGVSFLKLKGSPPPGFEKPSA